MLLNAENNNIMIGAYEANREIKTRFGTLRYTLRYIIMIVIIIIIIIIRNLDLSISSVKQTPQLFNFFFQLSFVLGGWGGLRYGKYSIQLGKLSTELGNRVGRRLCELAPAARGSQEARFTQPSARHSS